MHVCVHVLSHGGLMVMYVTAVVCVCYASAVSGIYLLPSRRRSLLHGGRGL